MSKDVDVKRLIAKYDYPNFESKDERWSEYLLADETILKIKAIPLKFVKRDKNCLVNWTVVIATFSPPMLIGEPSTASIPTVEADVAKALKEMDMKFDPVDEPWNEYDLEGGIKFFLKAIATSVSRVELNDAAGEPRYLVTHQVLTKRYPLFQRAKKSRKKGTPAQSPTQTSPE
jgi:hypothetical protein